MPSGIAYYRVSGAGNDFLALVEGEVEGPPDAATRAAWCRRGLSAGADGLFFLRRGEMIPGHAGEASTPSAVMEYYNADGQAAELCINGTRCAARLAFVLGWVGEGREIQILTGAGPVLARRPAEGPATEISLRLPGPIEPLREVTVELDGRVWEGFFLQVGVPHFVLPFREPLSRAPMRDVAPQLRRHPAFGEAGANVSFVRYAEEDGFELRTFERGVEAETLACGTAVLAAAALGLLIRRLELPATARVLGGFTLKLAADGWVAKEGRGSRQPASWLLTGDARIVARGELTPEAAALPMPPDW